LFTIASVYLNVRIAMASLKDDLRGYWFRSGLFAIEVGEDEETNPGRYGKNLAVWLKSRLEALGHPVEEVIPEDWGWCVMCRRDPFWLWVGCGCVSESEKVAGGSTPPTPDRVTWHCFVEGELPFWKRLFGKVSTHGAVSKLEAELLEILQAEPRVTMVPEP
jgi:hypothetical protein